jgi:hypothetical protein
VEPHTENREEAVTRWGLVGDRDGAGSIVVNGWAGRKPNAHIRFESRVEDL